MNTTCKLIGGCKELSEFEAWYACVVIGTVDVKSPFTTITPTTKVNNQENSLTLLWFIVPFAFAFVFFICFECLMLGIPCRRRKHRIKKPSSRNRSNAKTISDVHSTIDNDNMTSYGGLSTTSISSSHDVIRQTSVTDSCSICGNTASGDVIMGVSSFGRNRHRHYHDHNNRVPEGSGHGNALFSYHVPLKDHSSPDYVYETDSYDFERSLENSTYGARQGHYADCSSVSELYTARSTDFEDDPYTPRYTPTVSRSVSERVEVDVNNDSLEEDLAMTSPMTAYYPGVYAGLYPDGSIGPASLSTYSGQSRYQSQTSSDLAANSSSSLVSGGRSERFHHHNNHHHHHHHRDNSNSGRKNYNIRTDRSYTIPPNIVEHTKPPPKYVPRRPPSNNISSSFDEISVTARGIV
ncbi:uncharacterized protein [Apostichopus japonicus]|uniref:uncharacterized protein isoform X2 n=1 Tax=Stichopus japonicus TaxID=307972 RepID=UPI003AB40043